MTAQVEYKDFLVKDIFTIKNPSGQLTTKDLIDGNDIPYVAAKKTNNGIQKLCSSENIQASDILKGNCIVFIQQGDGSAGYSTYQPEDFYAISCVACGYIENILNEDIGLYLMTVLDKNKKLYSHSNSWTAEKLLHTPMHLPISKDEKGAPIKEFFEDEAGERQGRWHKEGYVPDWNYMESYIASYKNSLYGKIEKYMQMLVSNSLNTSS